MVGISSAGVAVIGKVALRHVLKLVYGTRESHQLVFHEGRADKWRKFVGRGKSLMKQIEGIIQLLDHEEEAFAAKFVSEVIRSREYLNDISIRAIERVRSEAKPVPDCFRSTLNRMHAQPPQSSSGSASSTYQPSSNGLPIRPK